MAEEEPKIKFIKKYKKVNNISEDSKYAGKLKDTFTLEKTLVERKNDYSVDEINGVKYVHFVDHPTTWYIFGGENNYEIIMRKVREPEDVTRLRKRLKEKVIDDKIKENAIAFQNLVYGLGEKHQREIGFPYANNP